MDTHRLNSFLPWQRSVQLAAEIIKLPASIKTQDPRFFEELTEDAIGRAANLADCYLNPEPMFSSWGSFDTRALALSVRLKAAELAGLIPEREARRLLAMHDEVERAVEHYFRSREQPTSTDPERTEIRPSWRKDDFKPLSGSKYPRPKQGQ
jgi:hypothetical protein